MGLKHHMVLSAVISQLLLIRCMNNYDHKRLQSLPSRKSRVQILPFIILSFLKSYDPIVIQFPLLLFNSVKSPL